MLENYFAQPSTIAYVDSGGFEIPRVGAVSETNLKRLASWIAVFVCTGNTCRSPMAEVLLRKRIAEKLGCTVARSLGEALTGADAVMALRIQNERIADALLPGARDYARTWGLNARTLEMLPRDALVLHPGPVNRGVELSSDVLDSPRSLVMDQVDSGVAVRMAVLALCLRAEAAA